MTAVFNARKLVTWHAIALTFVAMIVIITDMSPWTAQRRYCLLAHQPATGLTPMTGVGGLPLDITVIPHPHTMATGTDLDSVALNLTPAISAIGVAVARILIKVTPDHFTDLPVTASHVTGAPVLTAAVVTHSPQTFIPQKYLNK